MAISGPEIVREISRLRPNLLAYAVSIVGDEHLGDDLLQDVLVSAYEKRETIADVDHFAGWVRVAVRHAALNAIRNRRNKPTLDPSVIDMMDAHWDKYDKVDHSSTVEALRRCIGELSEYSQEIVRLRYTEGLMGQNLADRLSRKLPAVYAALTRTHKALAECVRRRIADKGATL